MRISNISPVQSNSDSLLPSSSTSSQTTPNGIKLPNLEQQTSNPPKNVFIEIVKTDIILLLQKNQNKILPRLDDNAKHIMLKEELVGKGKWYKEKPKHYN